MLKTFKVICFLFILIGSYCCTSKTSSNEVQETNSCIRENWIALKKEKNELLFSSTSDKTNIYEEIKGLLLNGEIRLWESTRINSEYLISPLPITIHDSIKYSGDTLYYNPYFDYLCKGETPIKDISGKDSLYTFPDGSRSYLYPLLKYEPVIFEKITGIRIKEILVHDTLRNLDFLKPSLIAFDVYTNHHNILFWLEVDVLKNKIKINRNWIDFIINKKYSGFSYKRYSCDDQDYEWKKVYH